MLVVVNQPHTEGFKMEGNIPVFVINYLKKSFGSENVNFEDEYVNVEDLDWYKEFKANETPGDNLKFYRTRDNLTQAQLAEKLGTTRQDVSGMERNCRPISKKTAKELASLFKTSPARFIQ